MNKEEAVIRAWEKVVTLIRKLIVFAAAVLFVFSDQLSEVGEAGLTSLLSDPDSMRILASMVILFLQGSPIDALLNIKKPQG